MSQMTDHHKNLYCHAIARMLIADAVLGDAEITFLDRLMTRLEITPEQRDEILNHVNVDEPLPLELRELASKDKAQLLNDLRQAAFMDGKFIPRESTILEQARALLEEDE